MNSQLFVASSVTQVKDIATLLPGELGLYAINTDTARLENANPLLKTDKLFASVGKLSGDIVNSREIDAITGGRSNVRKRNFEFKKIPYRDPVKQMVNLSTNYIGRSAFDEFSVKVNIRSAFEGYFGVENFFKTYSATGSFATQLALYTALAADFNADENIFVDSAVASASGLLITFKPDYVGYVTFLIDRDAVNHYDQVITNVEVLNEADSGAGTQAFLTALASKWSYWNGTEYTLNRLFPITETDQTIPAASDCYYLKWTNRNQVDESQTEAAFNVFQELIIAVPKDTDMTYFIQTCEALLGTKIETTPSFLL